MKGTQAMRAIVERLTANLRLVFPDATLRFTDDYQLEVRTTEWWGAVGTNLDADEAMTSAEVEQAVAAAAEDVADNLWPDERTEPWPPCPAHADHALNPRVVRGTACWVCSRDDRVAVPIGSVGPP
jgi:hypothetical protein